MLYENLHRAMKQCGYALGYWAIGDEEVFIDFPVKNELSLSLGTGIEDVLAVTREIYGVTGESSLSIDISPTTKQQDTDHD